MTNEQIRRFTAKIGDCPGFAARWFRSVAAGRAAA
jgi:hypothetical protein